MVTNKEKLFKLGKKMTDRVPYKLGLEKLTEDCPEYWGLVNVLDDEMVDIALSMKQRVPMTLEEIAKAAGRSDTKALEDKLQEMSCIGLLEYNWENPQHKKQYLLPLFVPAAHVRDDVHVPKGLRIISVKNIGEAIAAVLARDK